MNKLGFGFLRLPQSGSGDIDWPLLDTMVDKFLASGGSYFDMAYMRCWNRSAQSWQKVLRFPAPAVATV